MGAKPDDESPGYYRVVPAGTKRGGDDGKGSVNGIVIFSWRRNAPFRTPRPGPVAVEWKRGLKRAAGIFVTVSASGNPAGETPAPQLKMNFSRPFGSCCGRGPNLALKRKAIFGLSRSGQSGRATSPPSSRPSPPGENALKFFHALRP